ACLPKRRQTVAFSISCTTAILPLASGTRSQLWFLEPDVAYTFPNDDGVTLVAAMPARAKAAEWKAGPEGAMPRLFERLPRAPSLSQAQRVTPIHGNDRLSEPSAQRVQTRLGIDR